LSNDHDKHFGALALKRKRDGRLLEVLVGLKEHFETKLKTVEENHRVKSNSVQNENVNSWYTCRYAGGAGTTVGVDTKTATKLVC
jgi:hypothetical protein